MNDTVKMSIELGCGMRQQVIGRLESRSYPNKVVL
jgi:hypothetical protein